jgi:hypothetical protein
MPVETAPKLYERLLVEEAEDRFVEVHGVRAVSPDGGRAFELRLTIVAQGPTWVERDLECTVVVASRDAPAVVASQYAPWADCDLRRGLDLNTPQLTLDSMGTRGALGPVSWDLLYGSGIGPVLTLPARPLYRPGARNAKLLAPVGSAKFAGPVQVGDETLDLDGWMGERFHFWGNDWPGRFAWLSAQQWSDGGQRSVHAVKGFLDLGVRPLVTHMVQQDAHSRSRSTTRTGWAEPIGVVPSELRAKDLFASAGGFISLRHRRPDGGSIVRRWCPFTSVQAGGFASDAGSFEVFDDQALDDAAVPPEGWSQADGVFVAGL